MKSATFILGSALAVGLAAGALGIPESSAQQKQTVAWKAPATIAKVVQRHQFDVGDVPGHRTGLFELHRNFTGVPTAPVYDGVRVVGSRAYGYTDYTNANGRAWGYGVSTLENGDKVFSQFDGTSHTVTGPDGQPRSTYTGVTRIVGGTGRFATIRGLLRETTQFNIQLGMNEASAEGEYWFEAPAATAGAGSATGTTSGAASSSGAQPGASPK
jgi:hypothetical protein